MVTDLTPSGDFEQAGRATELAAALAELGRAQQPFQAKISRQWTFLDFIKRAILLDELVPQAAPNLITFSASPSVLAGMNRIIVFNEKKGKNR